MNGLEPNLAAHIFNELLGDIHAKACAWHICAVLILDTVKLLKNMTLLICRDT